MLTLVLCIPSVGGHEAAQASWITTMADQDHLSITLDDTRIGEGAGFINKLQHMYEITSEDVLGYMHSDLIIHEQGWDQRVLAEFADPNVAIVSFGGSLRHGHPDIYKVPYDYKQLARSSFLSNLTDAEDHGYRETGDRDVAVVDSFAMFIRHSFLTSVGAWPIDRYPPNHCSDYWACLSAHRSGQRVRMVGVSCTHAGGGKHQFDYPAWAATTRWGSDAEMHRAGHRLIYEEFRSVLPVEVS